MRDRKKFEYRDAPTYVYWDTVDCPVPKGLDAGTVIDNIYRGLYGCGYRNLEKVKAYGDVPEMARGAFAQGGILMAHVPAGTRGACRKSIFVDFLYDAIGQYHAVNKMLILGDISKNPEFQYAFQLLNDKGNFNFLLAQPNKISEVLVSPVDTIWLWSSLSLGREPFQVEGEPVEVVEEEEEEEEGEPVEVVEEEEEE